jgi:hypothetical protein
MDLEETKARNGCAGEGQQQFNRPTGGSWSNGLGARQSPASKDVRKKSGDFIEVRYRVTTSEGYNRMSLIVSCSQKKSAWMSDSIIITCS